MPTGKLKPTQKGWFVVEYTTARGATVQGQIPRDQLSADLAAKKPADIAALGEVEFELVNNIPQRIRAAGQAFVQPPAARSEPPRGGRGEQRGFPPRRDARPAPRNDDRRSADPAPAHGDAARQHVRGPTDRPPGAGRPDRRDDGRRDARPAGRVFENDLRGIRDMPRASARPRRESRRAREARGLTRDFHNPYNFVPAVPRDQVSGPLGDAIPPGHDQLYRDRWTGVIAVQLEVATPLLIHDPARTRHIARTPGTDHRRGEPEHPVVPVRLCSDGRTPYLPPSAVRGMLRAAYEAVTNSRMSVFRGHECRLSRRVASRDAAELVPARVQNGKIHLLTGTTPGLPELRENGEWQVPGNLAYAAWLPRYRRGQPPMNFPDGSRPRHGDDVVCWLERHRHHAWRRRERTHDANTFDYWKVVWIGRAGIDEPPPRPPPTVDAGRQEGTSHHQPLAEFHQCTGYVFISNRNVDGKHDERVFFGEPFDAEGKLLTEALRLQWRELIGDYQRIHADEIQERRRKRVSPERYLGRSPGETAWSPHVYRPSMLEPDGQLCYARVSKTESGYDIQSLHPVAMSRELHKESPANLLDATLHPAAKLSELSPADRVFGWSGKSETSVDSDLSQSPGGDDDAPSYKGQLRLGPVRCDSDDAVAWFDGAGMPMPVQGEPSQSQSRFYVAATPLGDALGNGIVARNAGFRPGRSLRGRKVYPHQPLIAPRDSQYWNDPMEDRTQSRRAAARDGQFQEYRRPHAGEARQVSRYRREPITSTDGTYAVRGGSANEQRDRHNHSITGWVRRGTTFSFDVHVCNLRDEELGALLWLLRLPVDPKRHTPACLRLGGGKPLGFGSVRLSAAQVNVRLGAAMREEYLSLGGASRTTDVSADLIDKFKQAVTQSYTDYVLRERAPTFENVSFIAAFLRAGWGFDDDLPVHYPRLRADFQPAGKPVAPHPDGEGHEWFTENERRGQRVSLPDLVHDAGLSA